MELDPNESAERGFAEARGTWSDEEADYFVEELAGIWAGWTRAEAWLTDDESARSPTARLPERWQRLDSGRPVGDIVAALDRSREGR